MFGFFTVFEAYDRNVAYVGNGSRSSRKQYLWDNVRMQPSSKTYFVLVTLLLQGLQLEIHDNLLFIQMIVKLTDVLSER